MKKFGVLLGGFALVCMVAACGSSRKIKQGSEEFSIDEGAYLEAMSLQDDGMYFEAIKAWQTVLKDEPRWALGNFNIALIYDQLNLVPEAIEHYELAVRWSEEHNDDANARALYNLHLGAAYVRASLPKEAVDALKKALATDQFNPYVHFNLSSAYIMRKDYDRALMHADSAVDLAAKPGPGGLDESVDRAELGKFILRQAECHLERGEWEKARTALMRARKQCNVEATPRMWDAIKNGEAAAKAAEKEGSEG
ncbi:MAG: tetratricopeptide repeat protein [Planctomycetes bacterium]|nr:tetratricopeptide repeat protein [Planctomycetota bacterium]MCW8135817.1 tetratricopeptide repeat protein [Planctomycetota bacterium]